MIIIRDFPWIQLFLSLPLPHPPRIIKSNKETSEMFINFMMVCSYCLSIVDSSKLGDNAVRSDISEAKQRLEPLKSRLREAIIFQGARVRKLEEGNEREEALKRQEILRADYKAATGLEWSDVRDEGPILMATNAVRGREVRGEMKQRLMDYSEQNIIR